MRAEDADREGHSPDTATWLAQLALGAVCQLGFCLPFVREVRGLAELPRRHYLFVCNHVSLLDTLLLGGIFWRARRLPILVMGDRAVWGVNAVRRLLAARIGFLIDRGRLRTDLIRQLQAFGRSHAGFNLIVFPEGTRGDGVTVQECQPGIVPVARAARVPIVPVYLANVQLVSSKTTPFRPVRGWRAVRVRFGAPWEPQDYLALEPEAMRAEVRARLQALGSSL